MFSWQSQKHNSRQWHPRPLKAKVENTYCHFFLTVLTRQVDDQTRVIMKGHSREIKQKVWAQEWWKTGVYHIWYDLPCLVRRDASLDFSCFCSNQRNTFFLPRYFQNISHLVSSRKFISIFLIFLKFQVYINSIKNFFIPIFNSTSFYLYVSKNRTESLYE